MRIIFLLLFACLAYKSIGQINLQTGSATFSLPVFSWQDNKSHLSSQVSLSYNSGNGLKVDEVASNEGQGWTLVGGGVITRLQVGEPDDQPEFAGNKGGGDDDITKYPAGILYAPVPVANGCPIALSNYPIYNQQNQVYTQHNITASDRELDHFSFQFNGKAGTFVVDPSHFGVAQPLGDTKMLITFIVDPNLIAQGIRTTITSFTIQDVDGSVYKFTQHGLTKVLQSGYCDKQLIQMQTQPTFNGQNVYHQAAFDGQLAYPWIINSWYLTEVDDALTHRSILYTYNTHYINDIAGCDVTYNSTKDYCIISHKTSISKTPEINSIAYPDGHNVTFNYGNERVDLAGENALASIDITFQGRYLSEYQLNTTYFILNRYGTPITYFQKRVARLCLKSVKKIGPDLKEDSPPYIFDYYMGRPIENTFLAALSGNSDDVVPPPFYYGKDIWGFYNGGNTVPYHYGYDGNSTTTPLFYDISSLPFDAVKGLCYINLNVPSHGLFLNPKANYAQNGLLKQIIYPTGGTLTYVYAQNQGVLDVNGNGPTTMVGGVHVSQTQSADGGYSNGCANPITTNYNYVLSDHVTSSLWGLELPVNYISNDSHYAKEQRHWKYIGCKWQYVNPGIMSQNEAVGLTDLQNFMNSIGPVLGVISVIGTALDIVNVCLDATPLAIISIALDIINAIVGIFTSCSSGSMDNDTEIFYNTDLNGISPLPTQFRRVEITESPGDEGMTVQEFTSNVGDNPFDLNYLSLWWPQNPDLVAWQRFAPWAYGLPKLTTIYNKDNQKVKETENDYDYRYAQFFVDGFGCSGKNETGTPCPPTIGNNITSTLASCKCQVLKSTSQRDIDWGDPTKYAGPGSYQLYSNNIMTVDFYGMFTGRVVLRKSLERSYSMTDNTQFSTKETDYVYNGDDNTQEPLNNVINYEVNQITTIQSNGDINTKNINYAGNYSGGLFATLLQDNIVALPVETNTGVTKGVGPNQYQLQQGLNESVTGFTQLANGDIRPYGTFEQRFSSPTDMILYQGQSSLSNPPYKQTQLFTYDGNSNLVGVQDEGNRTVTNIYGYGDEYVIASVINAVPGLTGDNPAYTSFEETAPPFGRWQLGSNQAVNHGNGAITGSYSFNLAGSGGNPSSLTASQLNTFKPYILSFWATSSNVSISGGSATLVKSAPTINGFTYYEYDIAQGASGITITGSASIDELRLYPASARMNTTTYDVILGKTSECDENNRVTYYSYDNLGRLKLISDENNNIVKMYDYNNVSAAKQNGCPGSYGNDPISDVVTKSDCGPGFVGSDVTITIPTGTYQSLGSPYDADIGAEDYLLSTAQSTANAQGSCIQVFYNAAQSQSFNTQTCSEGYAGSPVNYSVPAGKYSSTSSQADADQEALDEIAANGQAYANNNPVCTVSTDPDWSTPEGSATYCELEPTDGTAHLFAYVTDLNPYSPTANQSQWVDEGTQDACTVTGPGQFFTYYNSLQDSTFTNSGCTPPGGGATITYTIPIGEYTSSSSQADADQQARNDIRANGQNYANANGLCNVYLESDNQATGAWGMRAVNGLTGQVTIFNAELSGHSTTSFYLPQGNYTFFFTPLVPYTNTPTTQFNVNGVTQYIATGPGQVVFQNVIVPYLPLYDPFIVISANPLYYNAALSRSFTATNCGAGYVGTTFTYTVPAGKYSATNSGDAYDLAFADAITNGPAYANANNIDCNLALASSNTTSSAWILTATNSITGDVYTSTVSVLATGHITPLPPGNYKFVFTPPSSSATDPTVFNVNGASQELDITGGPNRIITFANVTVAAGAINNPFVSITEGSY
jgi:hypothetical protein